MAVRVLRTAKYPRRETRSASSQGRAFYPDKRVGSLRPSGGEGLLATQYGFDHGRNEGLAQISMPLADEGLTYDFSTDVTIARVATGQEQRQMKNITDLPQESTYPASLDAYIRSARHHIAAAEQALQMLESVLRKLDPRQMLLPFSQSEGEGD